MAKTANFSEVRTLDYTGISGTYAAVGDAFEKPVMGWCFTNTTEGHMMFSNDGSTDKVFVPAGNFKLWDVQANMNAKKDDAFVFPANTQWSVKQMSAAVSGSVYIEALHENKA